VNVLELFAGSRSIGKTAESFGHTVFSVDWQGDVFVIKLGDIIQTGSNKVKL
jgi:hypothetical protein